MSIEHNSLTDPNIHEPKGITTAANGSVYVANGSGTGTWKKQTGWAKYVDSLYTSGSPLSVSAGATITLPNNGASANTNTTNLSGSYDTATNKLLATTVGVSYLLTVSLSAAYTGSGTAHLEVALNTGSDIITTTVVLPKAASATHKLAINLPIQVDTAFNTNGALVKVIPSNASTLWDISFTINKLFSPT